MWKVSKTVYIFSLITTFFIISSFYLVPDSDAGSFVCQSGATVELDQKVYSWTDKVYITIVAPCHNKNSNVVEEIGSSASLPIKISTRFFDIDLYKLTETGTDTGIFTGELILTGFKHDADGQLNTGDIEGFDTFPGTSKDGSGPTNGLLEATSDDGITVSFEFEDDTTVVGSALIRWNSGEVQWLESSYPDAGTGVVRVIDPDMNLNPNVIDQFDIDVWSTSDAGGIDLTVTETNDATGIFEGIVLFTTTDESSENRLRIAKGDIITAEYEDNTLPVPFQVSAQQDIHARSIIAGPNVWLLDQIKGATLDLENNDAVIVFPMNIDSYFPFNRDLKEKIKNLMGSGQLEGDRLSELSDVRYVKNKLIVTKTSTIYTANYNEYVLIFGQDRNLPIKFKDQLGNTIDENEISHMIKLALDKCGAKKTGYCGNSVDDLKKLVFEKTGRHEIQETLIVNQITGISGGSDVQSAPFFDTLSANPSASEFGKFFPVDYSILPIAEAQSGQFVKNDEGNYNLSFLNGFTIGFAYERNWSYEFNVAGLVPIYIESHIKNGLGIGLRIPLDLLLQISTVQDNQNSDMVTFNVNHKIIPREINSAEYQELGLLPFQTFGGKEFNMYLGPRAYVLIQMLDRVIYEKDVNPLPFDLPEGSDFTPPLGAIENEEPITDYTIPCELTKTCFSFEDLVTIGLFLNVEANLAGGEVTLDSLLLNTNLPKQTMKFKQNDKASYSHKIQADNPNKVPYSIEIKNIQYVSNLHFVPKVSLEASFDSWLFPMEHNQELVRLPAIKFNDILLEPHAGVPSRFMDGGVVPEFGEITLMVLGGSIVFVIIIARKFSRFMNI